MAAHPGLLKNTKTPPHTINTNNNNNASNNGYVKDSIVTSKHPISEKEAAEVAAKTEINVAAMKVIFPNYGSGFLEACLLVIATHTHNTYTHTHTHTHTYIHTHTHTHNAYTHKHTHDIHTSAQQLRVAYAERLICTLTHTHTHGHPSILT